MEKLISHGRDLSGHESEAYLYNGGKIRVSEFFLYEVSIHKYWKDGYCLLGSKLFKSDKFLNIRHPNKYKRFKDYLIEKEISLIAAPYRFVQEMSLPIYNPNINKLKKSKKK